MQNKRQYCRLFTEGCVVFWSAVALKDELEPGRARENEQYTLPSQPSTVAITLLHSAFDKKNVQTLLHSRNHAQYEGIYLTTPLAVHESWEVSQPCKPECRILKQNTLNGGM